MTPLDPLYYLVGTSVVMESNGVAHLQLACELGPTAPMGPDTPV